MKNWFVVTVLALALSGCKVFGGGSCNKPREYTNSESVAPLKVPEGLDMPNTGSALRVPELDTPEQPRGPNDPCLDEPPRYATPAAAPAGAPPPK